MYKAKSREELVRILKEIRSKKKYVGFASGETLSSGFFKFGSESDSETKYDWQASHVPIEYESRSGNIETLDAKIYRISGRFLNSVRSIGEFFFNGQFIVQESQDEAIKRETNTYERLSRQGFSTLHPRQYLILDGLGQPKVNGVLLTKALKCNRPLVDLIKEAPNIEKWKYVKKNATCMRELHYCGEIWGDANPINAEIDAEGQITINNFGFKPNPTQKKSALQARDFIGLCLTSAYRIIDGQEFMGNKYDQRTLKEENILDAVYAVWSGYDPFPEIKKELFKILTKDQNKKNTPIISSIEEQFFHKLVYGLSTKDVKFVKHRILEIISRY